MPPPAGDAPAIGGADAPLEGLVGIVTGAGSGIGAGAARRLASEGASVACVDIDGEAAGGTVAEIERAGGRALPFEADVAAEPDLPRVVAELVDRFGRIDVLLANAGTSALGSAVDTSLAEWQHVYDVNVTGTWLSCKAVLPTMVEQRSGSIILTASVAGLVGRRASVSYGSSKAAVVALARQMSVDYGRHGIRVNALCPGTIDTPLARRTYAERGLVDLDAPDEGLARLGADYPLGRLGTIDDVSAAVAFLAGAGSTWITGTALVVDGGLTASRVAGTASPAAIVPGAGRAP